MTKDFLIGIKELFSQDIPHYCHQASNFLWSITAPFRTFAVDRALILTTAIWLILISLILLCLPFGNDRNPLNPSDWLRANDATGLRDYLWAMSFPLGALLVSLTLVNALRRTRIMDVQAGTDLTRAKTAERELEANISSKRDELNISTFTKSVEMLDSDKIMTRVGAVYSLEEILRSSSKDKDRLLFSKQIVDTLCAFTKEKISIRNKSRNNNDTEVVAALSAITRSWPDHLRKTHDDESKLNLSMCKFDEVLNNITLNMNYTNFSSSLFEALVLSSNDIVHSIFRGSKFEFCEFDFSTFNNCNFLGATFESSELTSCDFTKCNLSYIKGDSVDFRYSTFDRCSFSRTKIEGHIIDGCIFNFSDGLSDLKKKHFLKFIDNAVWEEPPTVPEWAAESIQNREV